jgi:UDP-arabinose 4-epimerase
MTAVVLVTGGAGYVGSHACKALDQAGFRPVVFDNLATGHADAVKWGLLEEGSILDGERLDTVFARHRPALVMHFAAFSFVGESVVAPAKYYQNNVVGSLSLLDAMVRNGVNNIIFSSTCATYGIPDSLPISEYTPQQPINAYGNTKLAVERALVDYERAYGIKWTAMRYFNAAGCDPDGEIGELHTPETHAIPLAIQAALGIGPRFKVFGADYPTRDGTAIRDYVHVSDLATAHAKATGYMLAGGASQAFNLGTGRGTSVLEIINAVEKATGRRVPIDYVDRRDGDPPALLALADRASALLDWTPRFVDINETVATAASWFMRRHNAIVRDQ